MPRVYLTTANYHSMPKRCVCCGCETSDAFRETGEHDAVKSQRAASIEFPACKPCQTHHRYDAGWMATLDERPPPRTPDCEATLCLADFVSWKGAEHIIDFDSPRFARLFVEANKAAKKKVRCDYDWVPPASRPPVHRSENPYPQGPIPPWNPGGTTSTASYVPPPPMVPPRSAGASTAFKIAIGTIFLFLAVCVAGMVLASRSPAPSPQPVQFMPQPSGGFAPGQPTNLPAPGDNNGDSRSGRHSRRHRRVDLPPKDPQ